MCDVRGDAVQLVEAIREDTQQLGQSLSCLRVDGGMVVNDTLLQLQADLLGIPVGEYMYTSQTCWEYLLVSGVYMYLSDLLEIAI